MIDPPSAGGTDLGYTFSSYPTIEPWPATAALS